MARKRKKNKWFDFTDEPDIKFLMKPSSRKLFAKHSTPSKKQEELVDDVTNMFCEYVIDWKGIENDDGSKLECNDKNKKEIADQNSDLCDFVLETVTENLNLSKKSKALREEIVKNLQKSAVGGGLKVE